MWKKWVCPACLFVVLSLCIGTGYADIKTGLIARWPLDEGSGVTAVDMAGNNDGKLATGVTWVEEGWIGKAVDMDGSGYIDCGNRSVYNVDTVTLAAWIQPKSDASYTNWQGVIMRGGPNIDTFAM